jgi:hypothetical protein
MLQQHNNWNPTFICVTICTLYFLWETWKVMICKLEHCWNNTTWECIQFNKQSMSDY